MGTANSRPEGQAEEQYGSIVALAPSESEVATNRSMLSTLGNMRALGQERHAALRERTDTFSGPGGAQWADVLDAISASDELQLDPNVLLKALQAMESWSLQCSTEISEMQNGVHKDMDSLDHEATQVLHELARIAAGMKRDAAQMESVNQLERQVDKVSTQIEGLLDTHQSILNALENMLPVSHLVQAHSGLSGASFSADM
uniref:Uncharacterized protein n=1 Tax=Tetraselmis chuii TaxID=63592 RepID=A0A7S1SXP5_9CHLO|mmetsp:Transcript_35112/g.62588  ORF Transcript_35112/g.62588 Transcript_35112/m.62588 type:complete len:202 (+) Transcript_35112:270-875(+)|eukprot:CAMPEP_0177751026 /NCGR_PEP_ID=MMETSP0491_2-20121128/154_1 /TAXON_ID=63592 /ORGANISM="Tetraselmis chuii, Strain PLY429" /LENGTH=201 /DNA_ID=CAMNT_0019266111 /DNA_START=303 /DNA_END=908 /DNA_ORIENTATION=+